MQPSGERSDATTPLVDLREVTLSYDARSGDVLALDRVSLAIEPGAFVCIVGPSGCGKSTLLRIVAGLLEPTSGEARMAGRIIDGPSAERGIVFQHAALYPWLSVADNVAFGPRMRGMTRPLREARVREMLALVGLGDAGRRAPWELSGGMQQRAAIARVLINEPRVMLMDEPFGALDALTRDRMQDELLRIWRTTQATIVLITHSVEEAVYLGTRTLVMSPRPGRIVADVATPFSRASGSGPAIKASPAFIAARESVRSHIAADPERSPGG